MASAGVRCAGSLVGGPRVAPEIVPVPYQTLIKVFEKEGFTFARQSGVRRPLVIPAYKAVPVFIIKNLIRTSGMSRERYFELLGM